MKGPDNVIEIVQDNPLTFLSGEPSHLPGPWRPVGRGAVLDEDITKIPSSPGLLGLRPISKKTFERMIQIGEMI
ncbi:MAG: hypothetical protein ACTSW3_02120, partial [Promethearchaeota archaeon]